MASKEDWETTMEKILIERADVWQRLARGYTSGDLEIAAVLRSIVADIEGPHPADWADIAYALRYILQQVEGGASELPPATLPPWTGDPLDYGTESCTTNVNQFGKWTVIYSA